MKYDILSNGEVHVSENFYPGSSTLSEIPLIGNAINLPNQIDRFTWYGKGPYETYVDRKLASNVGVYSKTVDENFFPYIQPQETGNHIETEWMKIVNQNNTGILIAGDKFEFSALRYTPFEMGNKLHPFDLVKSDNTILNINYKQMGVGGDNSWGALPHDEFLIKPTSNYGYNYRIVPVKADGKEMEISKKQYVSEPTLIIPDIKGLTEDAAKQLIIKSGLVPGKRTYGFGGTSAKDLVLQQFPNAGEIVSSGYIVNYFLSLENIALNKTATSSSMENNNPTTSGNDGNTSTRWCASNGNSNQWWSFYLGDKYDLEYYSINWEKAANYKYLIEVSEDNISWSNAVDNRKNSLSDQTQSGAITSNSVRYVRITITQNPTNLWSSFYEFEIYGIKSAANALNNLKSDNEFKIDVYPNLVDKNTTIKYTLSGGTSVKVELYNSGGKKLTNLVNDYQESGIHQIALNNEYVPGIYFLGFDLNNRNYFHKLILK